MLDKGLLFGLGGFQNVHFTKVFNKMKDVFSCQFGYSK